MPKHFTKLQKMKDTKSKIKPNPKTTWNNILSWVQRLYAEI